MKMKTITMNDNFEPISCIDLTSKCKTLSESPDIKTTYNKFYKNFIKSIKNSESITNIEDILTDICISVPNKKKLDKINLIDKTLINIGAIFNKDDTKSDDIIKKKVKDIELLSAIVKIGICNIISDNIESDKNESSNDVEVIDGQKWYEAVLGNGKILQVNIYILSFIICLYFKYKILNISWKYLGMICLLYTLFLLFNLFNESVASEFYKYINKNIIALEILIPIIIIISICIRFYEIKKYLSLGFSILIIIILIMFIIRVVMYYWNVNIEKINIKWINILILIFSIFTLLYIALKNSDIIPSYFIIFVILLFIILLYFYLKIPNRILSNAGFYLLFIFIMILIFNLNSYVLKRSTKSFFDYLKLTSTPPDNILGKSILIIYKIISVFGDTILTIMAPQLSLSLLIIFRLINGYWYEPLNAVYASLSGYHMNKSGNIPTTNSFIL